MDMRKVAEKASAILHNPLFWILLLALFARSIDIDVYFSGHQSVKEVQIGGAALRFMREGNYFTPRHFVTAAQGNAFPLPSYIIMAFWYLFGVHEWAARLPMVLAGVGSVYLLYRIMLELNGKDLHGENMQGENAHGRKTALIASFFLAVMPMHIYFSRLAGQTSIALFFSLFSIYYFIRWSGSAEFKYGVASAAFLSLAALVRYLPIYLLLPYFLYLWLNKRERVRVREIVPLAAIAIVPMLVWIVHASQFFPMWALDKTTFITAKALFHPEILINNIGIVSAGMNPIIILLVLFALYKSALNKPMYTRRDYRSFPYLWLLSTGLLLLSILTRISSGNIYYNVILAPCLAAVAAVGLGRIELDKRKLGAFLGLVLLVSILPTYLFYSVEYPYAEAGLYMKDKLGPGETIGYLESSAICYYADVLCAYVPSLQILQDIEAGSMYIEGWYPEPLILPYAPEARHIKYVAVPSVNYENYLKQDYKDYLADNYVLEKTVYGKQNILGKNFKKKQEPEYVLIFRNKA